MEESPNAEPSGRELALTETQNRTRQEALLKSVVESCQADGTPHPISLSTALAEVVDNYRPVAEAKAVNLRVEVRVDPNLRFVTDPVRVRLIIANLMANALRYTDRGTITAEVDILRQFQDEATVRISVTDTGIGISEDSLSTVLAPNLEADLHPSHRSGTAGGGLANCVDCVKRLGGTISVESKEGSGSCFVVELTLKTQMEAESASAVPTNDLTGLHVLIVEDNDVNQLILRRILEQQSCQVDVMANGRQAVDWLRSNHCDIVLMDCQMPEMDGFEATRLIRQFPWPMRDVPIVAVTANAMSGDREACLEAGMNDYISKPIRRDALTQAIGKLVFARFA